jgi:hypothetical protein
MFFSNYYLCDDWLRDWFFTPAKEDGMPRIMRINAWKDDSITTFIGQLKKVYCIKVL